MSRKQKSTTLYPHPFSKAYWQDAVAELADLKMLVFAALIVALRVALKTLVRIPLGPSLDITPAFLANALGAMVYGPVMGALGAIVSDFLGVMLRGDEYFLPYVLTEIAGSMIFAMFFYRQKVTTTRVILSRFTICLVVNILLQTPIDILYNLYKGLTVDIAKLLALPRIFKNLFMFPIESVVLMVFLSAIQPITYRMRLTYNSDVNLRFNAKQVALLVTLVVVGIGSVVGYLFVHYDNTSLSASYTAQERMEANQSMQTYLKEKTDDWDETQTLTVVESAYKKFMGKEITYTVAVYEMTDDKAPTDAQWGMSKSKAAAAAKQGAMTRVATATIVVDEKTGQVLQFTIENP